MGKSKSFKHLNPWMDEDRTMAILKEKYGATPDVILRNAYRAYRTIEMQNDPRKKKEFYKLIDELEGRRMTLDDFDMTKKEYPDAVKVEAGEVYNLDTNEIVVFDPEKYTFTMEPVEPCSCEKSEDCFCSKELKDSRVYYEKGLNVRNKFVRIEELPDEENKIMV